MPRQKKDLHLHALASRGAEVRLRELVSELKFLVSSFPALRDSFDADELPVPFILGKASGQITRKRAGRRKMSAADRKAVSVRMKKYWEARRKAAKE